MSDDPILKLRAALRSVTDLLEDVLDTGRPRKGRTVDDRDAWDGWWIDATSIVKRARAALEETKDL